MTTTGYSPPLRNLLDSTFTYSRDSWGKIAFVSLIYLDVLLTLIALSMGFTEMNALAKTLFESPLRLALLKVALPPVLAWLSPALLLLPSIAIMCLVNLWNIKELFLGLS